MPHPLRLIAPTLLVGAAALLLGAEPDPLRAAHDRSAALSAEAFAELDRTMAKLAADDAGRVAAERGQREADRRALPPAKPVTPAPAPTTGTTVASAPMTTGPLLVTTLGADPVDSLQQIIASLGLTGGVQSRNGQTLIVATGVAQVQGTQGGPGWIEARAAAYQIAALRARAELAASLGEEILSGRSTEVASLPPALDTGAKPMARSAIAGTAKSLDQQRLDAELRKLGVPPEQYEPLTDEARRALFVERYEQSIRTRAAAALGGVATLAVTEGPWQGSQTLAVALVWSQNLAKIAAIGTTAGDRLPPRPPAPGPAIRNQIPTEGILLARRFGVQRLVDETGDQVLVAYGQAALPQVGPALRASALAAAFDQAALEAKAMLKDFVWAEVSSEANRSFSQVAQALSGERSGALTAALQQASEYRRTVRTAATTLTLVGAGEVRRWTATVDGAEVAGAIVAWSPRRTQLAAGALAGPGSTVTGPTSTGGAANGPGTSTFDPSW